MSVLTKFSAVAAALAVTATSAAALEIVETSVPNSFETSRLNDTVHYDTVKLFVDDLAAPASVDETLADYTDDITTTEVSSSLNTQVPGSLANTRLFQR